MEVFVYFNRSTMAKYSFISEMLATCMCVIGALHEPDYYDFIFYLVDLSDYAVHRKSQTTKNRECGENRQ